MADLPPATPASGLAPVPTVAEVQVTAPRLPPSPAMAAFAVVRLPSETLERSPRLAEALRRVPGVELFRRSPWRRRRSSRAPGRAPTARGP